MDMGYRVYVGRRLPFFARFPQPAAMGMDALNVDWRTLSSVLYSCHPSTLLEKVVPKISLAPVSVVLIVPVWQKLGDFCVGRDHAGFYRCT